MTKIMIDGLDDCGQVNDGSCYVILSSQEELGINLSLHCIPSDATGHVFIASNHIESFYKFYFKSQTDIFSLLKNDQISSYSFEPKLEYHDPKVFVREFFDELGFTHNLSGAVVILHIEEVVFSKMSFDDIKIFLHHIKQYAIKFDMKVFCIINASLSNKNRLNVKTFSQILDGVVEVNTNAGIFSAYFDFWHHEKGVTTNKEFEIINDDGFLTAKQSSERSSSDNVNWFHLIDNDDVYICKDAVPSDAHLPPLYYVLPDNDAIYFEGLKRESCTLIFTVTRHTDQVRLGEQCLELRRKCGPWLKIIIKNIDGIIRHQDECLFITVGVNLILHSSTDISRVMSQVQAIQGFKFSRELPNSYNEVLNFSKGAISKGYLNITNFIAEVSKHRKSSHNLGVTGVLVILKILNDLDPIHTLKLFKMKRNGDFFTSDSTSVYLYLHACRENDVTTALSRLFRLSISEFFLSHHVYSQDLYIEEQLKFLNSLISDADIEDYTQKLNNASVGEKNQEIEHQNHDLKPSYYMPKFQLSAIMSPQNFIQEKGDE